MRLNGMQGGAAEAIRLWAALRAGQATKGARWMPWEHGPMKDAAWRRNAPGSCLAS